MKMRGNAVKYLETEIRPSIVTDVLDVAVYHGKRQTLKGASHHSIPRNVFCYIDHLGCVAFGGTPTARGVKFIEEFFPARYRPLADLVYAMWRHGTVHAYKPYSYHATVDGASPKDVVVRWLSTNHNRKIERRQHMLVFPMRGKPDTVYLVINNCQLADDLVSAVDEFIKRLRLDHTWRQECTVRVAALFKPCGIAEVQGKTRAATVRDQIEYAWGSQGGLLDRKGNVAKRHPSS